MERAPKSLFLSDQNMFLATDLYQLTMMASYIHHGMEEPATFELFVRRLPRKRAYLVVAGLEQCLHYILNLRFDDDAIAYLRQHPVFEHVPENFFERLRQWRFTGDIRAMPEGTIAFPNEAMIQVRAPLFEAQLIETYLLSVINYQTTVASKAARIVEAAGDRSCIDFGSRRAHGPQAAVYAARAAYIGGMNGTSNVLAGRLCHIPVRGTAAHSYVMACPSEEVSFQRYHATFPEHSTLLVDTYDTLRGAQRATEIPGKLAGIRLDSGDMGKLSIETRKILDDAGRKDSIIVASGDLNEYKIERLIADGARIDAFGVGTELVTSRDEPALGGVYKLVSRMVDGEEKPAIKLAENKITYPGTKQFWRLSHPTGVFDHDVMQLAETDAPDPTAEPLLVDVVKDGELVYDLPTVSAIQDYCREQRRRIPDSLRPLEDFGSYPIHVGDDVNLLINQLSARHGKDVEDTAE